LLRGYKRLISRRSRFCTSCVAAAFVFASSVPGIAAAKPAPIAGRLSKPGYTVLALAASGRTRSAVATHGRFRLRPPARRVTLQLRAPDGVYAGPIVVGRDGKLAIVGVRAGAKLGRIVVKARKGYAKPKRNVAAKWLDPKRAARARDGVPIGAGNFGRVRSRHARGPASDPDLDGIPNPLDVDDDGDLVLDDNDRSASAGASEAARASQLPVEPHIFSILSLYLDQTVNANAASLTDQQIDAAFSSFGSLNVVVLPGDSNELDCGALTYCSRGGTGRIPAYQLPRSEWPRFPECCDPDGDGFGTLTPTGPGVPGAPLGGVAIAHGATTSQMGTGDVLIQRVTADGVETQFPYALDYVFATVPALVSYNDGQGSAATIQYPVPPPDPETGRGGALGTRENPIPVAAGPDGNVVLKLTFWRPQRRPIAGETCLPPAGRPCSPSDWIDIGGLDYTAAVSDMGSACPQSAFSSTDPSLTPPTVETSVFNSGRGGFVDLAADRPAKPTNTLTYTLDLTQCLVANGVSFNPGEERGIDFQGISPNFGGVADQSVFFRRQ
jgi:hypothetical protein